MHSFIKLCLHRVIDFDENVVDICMDSFVDLHVQPCYFFTGIISKYGIFFGLEFNFGFCKCLLSQSCSISLYGLINDGFGDMLD